MKTPPKTPENLFMRPEGCECKIVGTKIKLCKQCKNQSQGEVYRLDSSSHKKVKGILSENHSPLTPDTQNQNGI